MRRCCKQHVHFVLTIWIFQHGRIIDFSLSYLDLASKSVQIDIDKSTYHPIFSQDSNEHLWKFQNVATCRLPDKIG